MRDPRGFALKFYTEEGNWDLVGNNTPIFFIRDPILVSVGTCSCVMTDTAYGEKGRARVMSARFWANMLAFALCLREVH